MSDKVWVANSVRHAGRIEENPPRPFRLPPLPSYAELFFEQLAILGLMMLASVGGFALLVWLLTLVSP